MLFVERAVFVVLVLGALLVPGWRETLADLWITLNIVYAVTACAWVTLHGRALWRVRDSILRWAICSSVFGGLVFYTAQFDAAASGGNSSGVPSTLESIGPTLLLPIWFILFCGLMVVGLLGGSVGSFAGRRSGDNEHSARIGVTLSMASTIALVFAVAFLPKNVRADGWRLAVLFCSFPLLTRLYAQTQPNFAGPVKHWMQPANRLLTTCLRWRWHTPTLPFANALPFARRIPVRKSMVTLDMRGAMLGFVVAVLLLRIPAQFVGPLQSQALTGLTHLRATITAATSLFPPETFPVEQRRKAAQARERFVILRMDLQTRYDAAHRSEAEVQADIITRLEKWGVKRVVLPLPALKGKMISGQTSQNDGPAPDDDDVKHNRAYAPLLARLLRSTPNIALAVPSSVDFEDARVKLLVGAASSVGTAEVSRSPATYLPIVPKRMA